MSRKHHLFLATLLWVASMGSAQIATYFPPPDIANITYASVGGVDLKLDLFLPTTGPGPYPVVVLIHGGAWVFLDKSYEWYEGPDLVAMGFAAACIDFRPSLIATWPAQLHDCKAAVRFLRANAATWNLDPNRIAAYGYSSGGQLAAMLGVAQNDPFLEGTVGNHLNVSSAVQCWASVGGPFDMAQWQVHFTPAQQWVPWVLGGVLDPMNPTAPGIGPMPPFQLAQTADPVNYATSDDAPGYISQGELDEVTPTEMTVELYDALRAVGVDCELRIAPGQQHGFVGYEYTRRNYFYLRKLYPTSVPPAATLTLTNPIVMDQPTTLTIQGAPYAMCFLLLSTEPYFLDIGTFGQLLVPPNLSQSTGTMFLDANGQFQITTVFPPILSLQYYNLHLQGLAETGTGNGQFAFTNYIATQLRMPPPP